MDKNRIAYQNGYISRKYDRINLTVPKGKKEYYKQKAAEEGKQLNTIINELLRSWAEEPNANSSDENKVDRLDTLISDLDFMNAASVKELAAHGFLTLRDYKERYWEDDPDDYCTDEEDDKLGKLIGLYRKNW